MNGFSGSGANLSQEIAVLLESPPCPLCGGKAGPVIVEAADDWNPQGPAQGLTFAVRRCSSCSAAFTSPRFRIESKHIPFQGSYPFYDRAKKSVGKIGEREMKPFLHRAERIAKAHPAPGRLLDLGMGDGVFMLTMQRRGWSVAGVDNEPDVVKFAQEHLLLENCVAADVEDDPFPPGPFDAITMWGVLQLIYRPQPFLEKVRQLLAPGGVVGIGVSNFRSAGARLFGSSWNGLGLPRHLVHYEPQSLSRLLERCGFRILDLSFETPHWIAANSMRAVLPMPGLLAALTRRAAAISLGIIGRSRLGDTMTITAGRVE